MTRPSFDSPITISTGHSGQPSPKSRLEIITQNPVQRNHRHLCYLAKKKRKNYFFLDKIFHFLDPRRWIESFQDHIFRSEKCIASGIWIFCPAAFLAIPIFEPNSGKRSALISDQGSLHEAKPEKNLGLRSSNLFLWVNRAKSPAKKEIRRICLHVIGLISLMHSSNQGSQSIN